jgi:hypothetical protein
MNEVITIPKKLEPIVKAFYAESPETAKALIIQATKAIYGFDDDNDYLSSYGRKNHEITEEELEGICAMIDGIRPIDMLEALFASQIIVSHLLGLRKLARGHINDQRLGLKLLRFSSEAINQLQKKRSGGMQNICVTYNHNGPGPALVQTVLADSKGSLCQ